MIPNIHQSIDEIIKTASPAQKIIWQHVRLISGENAAVRQVYLTGTLAGHEINTYVANKLYLAVSFILWTNQDAGASRQVFQVLDENNALTFNIGDPRPLYNVAGGVVNYNDAIIRLDDVYFSRINSILGAVFFKFIGYKINS